MQELKAEELVELASIMVTLMIFYSIDAKFRFQRKEKTAQGLFRVVSIVGGIVTAIAALIIWVEMFLPEENKTIPVLAYFIPATIAITAALILAFEVLVLRFKDQQNDESEESG